MLADATQTTTAMLLQAGAVGTAAVLIAAWAGWRYRRPLRSRLAVAGLAGAVALAPLDGAALWLAGDMLWRWSARERLQQHFEADPLAAALLPPGGRERADLLDEVAALRERALDAVSDRFDAALHRILSSEFTSMITIVPAADLLAYAEAVATAALAVSDQDCEQWLAGPPTRDITGGADERLAAAVDTVADRLRTAVDAGLRRPVGAGPPPPNRAMSILMARVQHRLGARPASDCGLAAITLDEALGAPPSLRAPLVRLVLLAE